MGKKVEGRTPRKLAPLPLAWPAKLPADQESILDFIPALVFHKDADNRMVRVNKALAEVMRLPKSQIEGRHCSELWPGQAEQYWKDDQDVIGRGARKGTSLSRSSPRKGRDGFRRTRSRSGTRRGAWSE
jgi:PAS domain-containing protein